MTGDVGLPMDGRDHVEQLVRQAFALLGDGERPDPERAGDVTVWLLDQVEDYGGDAALFEVGATCARILAGTPTIPGVSSVGPLTWKGYGRAGGTAPHTPTDYAVRTFVNAIAAHDRPAAWAAFAPYAPAGGQYSAGLGDFLGTLLRDAWGRFSGGGAMIEIRPGDQWPPTCDFCCHHPAAWMWRCDPGDLTFGSDIGGDTTLRIEDFEFWYACPGCKLHIGARPKWELVYARHNRYNGGRSRDLLTAMWQAFEIARRDVNPERLPDRRPTPGSGPR